MRGKCKCVWTFLKNETLKSRIELLTDICPHKVVLASLCNQMRLFSEKQNISKENKVSSRTCLRFHENFAATFDATRDHNSLIEATDRARWSHRRMPKQLLYCAFDYASNPAWHRTPIKERSRFPSVLVYRHSWRLWVHNINAKVVAANLLLH